MSVNLSRKEPKLNSMYPITIKDSTDSINCRINFNIIDFLYLSLIRKNNCNKTDYYEKLYDFLAIGENYYEALRNGKKIDIIKQDKSFRYVKTNELINGNIRLEIAGVSAKQWKKYFWICKKYTNLKKAGADRKYVDEARKRKEQFQKLILRKIDHMEMNEKACYIYREMSVYLFEDELSKLYRSKGESWLEFLKGITRNDLEGLLQTDKKRFNEVYRQFYTVLMQMKELKNNKI